MPEFTPEYASAPIAEDERKDLLDTLGKGHWDYRDKKRPRLNPNSYAA